jgi:leader peptidase (prepilin peptidase)/N-methyltransferase
MASGRRCCKLLASGAAILLARPGARAHTHVLWLGLAGLVALLAQSREVGWHLPPSLALFAALVIVVLYDVEYFIIPDGPILLMIVAGLATLGLAPGEAPAHIAAAAVGWASFRLLDWGYARWRGVAGLGQGDARLFGVAGLWLGLDGLAGCLLIAACSGMISAAILLRERRVTHAQEAMPFGPHLALALWLSWVFGPIQGG